MQTHAPLIDADGEVRELTAADMAQFRPAHKVLPAAMHATLGIRRRSPQKAPAKTATKDGSQIGAMETINDLLNTRATHSQRGDLTRWLDKAPDVAELPEDAIDG